MPYYICITPIGKYEKDEVISGHQYRDLTQWQRRYFKPYDSNKPGKTFKEEIEDNIIEEDRLEKE